VIGSGLIGGLTQWILSLHGWIALAIVFAVPALEASAFVGFVFPGEIAVLLGGVLAYEHRIALPAAILAAVAGAILGDTAGYFIGKRWGRTLLQGTLGKLPLIRRHFDESLDMAREQMRKRRGRAVFFGRFTTALRVLVPGLAGMSDVPFSTFLAYNAAGGILWAGGFVLLGFFGGAGYRHIEGIAGRLGLILLGVLMASLIISRLARRSERLKAWGERLAASPPLAWVRRRFPRQVAWGRRRLDPKTSTGFSLTFTFAVGALAAWTFGGLTQDVVGHDELFRVDPRVEAFVISHRLGWVTGFMKGVTWLGSAAVLIPLAILVGGYFLLQRRDWRPGAALAVALAGAIALSDIVKPLVRRARPPVTHWIGHSSGFAFPSGHAAQSVAFFGMLALVLSTSRSRRVQAIVWSGAGLIALIVGASRIYLGSHWLTDVLGGFALGAGWLSAVVATVLLARLRPSLQGPLHRPVVPIL
jgi:membrane protein DedA with SNARE-associated domain/membrane-associated phospholipid phosphatase